MPRRTAEQGNNDKTTVTKPRSPSSSEPLASERSGMVDSILSFQRTRGNRFVRQWLATAAIQRSQGRRLLAHEKGDGKAITAQTRLRVSDPGDHFEQEADRVADEVMRMAELEVSKPGSACRIGISRARSQCDGIGRQAIDEDEQKISRQAVDEDEEKISRQAVDDDEEKISRQAREAGGHNLEVSGEMHGQINALRGGGSPLEESARTFFEPRFDCDFSDVRIHTDSRAAELARGMNALAFTVGRDVAFGAGRYSPDSAEGRKLLAHELTHVVQQTGPVQRKTPNDGLHNSCRRAVENDVRTRLSGGAHASRRVGRLKAPRSIQRRLVTFGTLPDVNALLGLIGPAAGLTLTLNVANNQTQIAAVLPGVPPSPALRTQLTTIINHARQHAEVIIARGQPQVQVGAFPQPSDLTVTRVQQIDIDDILAIDAGAPGNGVAKAAHEIQENFQAHGVTPVAGRDRFSRAHERAVAAESAVTAQLIGPGRRDGGVTINTGAGTTTVIQDFENYYLVYTTSLVAATQDVTVTSARRAAPVVISARTIDNYASGATAVPAAGAGTIALAAADVAANPTSTVMIEGFSDSRGSAAGNLTSSRRRAERARAALVTAGVGTGQIRIEPRGATNFVAPNNNAANRALNRRVVITVRRPGP